MILFLAFFVALNEFLSTSTCLYARFSTDEVTFGGLNFGTRGNEGEENIMGLVREAIDGTEIIQRCNKALGAGFELQFHLAGK